MEPEPTFLILIFFLQLVKLFRFMTKTCRAVSFSRQWDFKCPEPTKNRPTPQHIHTSLNILNLTQTLVEVSFGAAVVVVIVFFLTLRLFFPARREAKILSASSPRSNSSSAAGDGFFLPPVGLNCGGGLSVSDVAASSVTMAFNVVFGLNRPNRELVFGLVEGAVFSPYELSTLKKHVF